jgi:hypothetical protein
LSLRAKIAGRKLAARCLATGLACILACTALAQDGDPLAALQHGSLIVWVVKPTKERKPDNHIIAYAAPEPGYHESTIEALGQSSSSFGHDAANYGVDAGSNTISAPSSPTAINARAPGDDVPAGVGYAEQTSGNYGQTAGSFGKNASDHGVTTGALGQSAGSVGQTSGSYGQTAGSFGDSLATVGQTKRTTLQPFRLPVRPAATTFEQDLQSAFRGLRVQYSDVYADDLQNYLATAAATQSSPDVLLGPATWTGWQKIERSFGVTLVPRADFVADGFGDDDGATPGYALIAGARHPDAARAFVLWASERSEDCERCEPGYIAGDMSADERAAAIVAMGAMEHVVQGNGVGSIADASMVSYSPKLGLLKTEAGNVATDATSAHVVHSTVNGTLAAVTLRISVSSNSQFGLSHPLVVLRKRGNTWRVLHISLNLPAIEAERARIALTGDTTPASRTEQTSGVLGVTLSAPVDNDTTQPTPELGWANGGGAGLQVIEWQSCGGSECSDSHLYFVPDDSERLRTQASAEFAAKNGKYRWRVWSIGKDGAMKLTTWRTFNVSQ